MVAKVIIPLIFYFTSLLKQFIIKWEGSWKHFDYSHSGLAVKPSNDFVVFASSLIKN